MKMRYLILLFLCMVSGVNAALLCDDGLLLNGNLDSGTQGQINNGGSLDNWTAWGLQSGWIAADAIYYKGVMSVKLWYDDTGITQNLVVTPGFGYTVSVDMISNPGDQLRGWNGIVTIYWKDAGGSILSSETVAKWYGAIILNNGTVVDPGDVPRVWKTVTNRVTAPDGAVSADIDIALERQDDPDDLYQLGGAVYFDDLSVCDNGAYNPRPQDTQRFASAPYPTDLMWDVKVEDGNDFSYEVYFNDDPNLADMAIIGSGLGTGPTTDLSETIPITIVAEKEYYWRVDVNDIDNGILYTGALWTFDTFNPPAGIVENQPNIQNLWQASGNPAVQLSIDATATGKAGSTVVWTSNPAVTFTPSMSTLTDPDVIVTFPVVSEPNTFELTITVDDGIETGSNTIYVIVIPYGYDGLTALYEFEGNADDSVGGHNGILVGGAVVDTVGAQVGTGSLLLNAANQKVDVTDSGVETPDWENLSAYWADFQTTNQLTVSAWVKVDQFLSSYQNIIYKGTGYALIRRAETGNTMFRIGSGESVSDSRPEVVASDDDAINIDVEDNNWHHVAGTFNGGAVRLYVDGILEKETNDTQYLNSFPLGGNYLSIGNGLNGRIDQVRLHDIALSDQMIMDQFIGDGGTNSCRQQYMTSDMDKDCDTDLEDLAIIAAEWLYCSDQTDPACTDSIP